MLGVTGNSPVKGFGGTVTTADRCVLLPLYVVVSADAAAAVLLLLLFSAEVESVCTAEGGEQWDNYTSLVAGYLRKN